ncbi:MAG: hypothetical protein M5U01_33375 [Ardenticatenaceae bacterium]|nr:hypothetical protein [Ardenticatenaceae bacterium]
MPPRHPPPGAADRGGPRAAAGRPLAAGSGAPAGAVVPLSLGLDRALQRERVVPHGSAWIARSRRWSPDLTIQRERGPLWLGLERQIRREQGPFGSAWIVRSRPARPGSGIWREQGATRWGRGRLAVVAGSDAPAGTGALWLGLDRQIQAVVAGSDDPAGTGPLWLGLERQIPARPAGVGGPREPGASYDQAGLMAGRTG